MIVRVQPRALLLLVIGVVVLVAAFVMAQDALRLTEDLSVKARPSTTPTPGPSDVIVHEPPTRFDALAGIGTIAIDARDAPPHIRDAIDFLKGWGRRDAALLARVSTGSTSVRFDDLVLPLHAVRLTLPAMGLTVHTRAGGDVTSVRVARLYVRDRGYGTLRGRSATLMLVRDGQEYRVTSVLIGETVP